MKLSSNRNLILFFHSAGRRGIQARQQATAGCLFCTRGSLGMIPKQYMLLCEGDSTKDPEDVGKHLR